MMPNSEFKQTYGISYAYLHERVRFSLSQIIPMKCTKCGSADNIELANVVGHNYSEDTRDYTFLCRRCHIAFDNRYANLKQGADAIYKKSLFYNPGMTEKECTKCNTIKALSEFTGSGSYCKKCDNQIHKDKLLAKGTSRILKLRADISRGVRTCKICNTEKPLTEFVKNRSTTRTVCKLCYRKTQNERYQNRIDLRCY